MKKRTFMLTLPDGKTVRCWAKDAEAIRRDVYLTGNVYLVRPDGSEIYERVAQDSIDAVIMKPQARHVS